ncbi:MAG TPA: cell division protein FtsZ [Hyphomicrobium sp.]|nr:cell division protein FtsZ [Hyphomicrobium sp.]
MSLKLQLPKLVDVKPRLTVIGVGGAGCNAVNNMIAAGLQGVEFVVANTDAQSLAASSAEHRIQLGSNLTEGLGAGSKPEIGEAAAEEALEEIRTHVAGAHMVFIAAGMGGGTGTGAAAVIARAARELGILTVGIVTRPFQFEGARRMRIAEAGVQTLRQHVDTLIVIPNQNLFRIANERTTFAEAFVLADQVLYSGVACIVDLVLKEGLINLDFADVRTVMSGMGTAMMGTGEASGDRRAILAAEEAIANPLLDDVSLRGARGLLLAITGGRDLTLYEVDEAASRVREEVDPDCNIIVGATFDENLGERVRVSIVASGMRRIGAEQAPVQPQQAAQVPGQSTSALQAPAGFGLGASGARQGTAPAYMPGAAPPMPPLPGYGQAPAGREDVERRLAEAFTISGPPPAPCQPADIGQAPARPSLWQSPGNVTIEDGFKPFAHHAGRPPAGASGSIQQSNDQHIAPAASGFEPAAPEPVRRAARRMPAIEDLPEIGQREWHARQSSNAPAPARAEDLRKRGFFDRLTGMGMGKRPANATQQTPQNESGDDSPLPSFFARDGR